ncbi:antibiotic biosynthesis monooxygenase family protein [Saccharothrix variisporea]|uniref:Antibiotic biosynthesis monooxygenase n=1 Tax=Saccharothrix variisporea TaxID=543527 RepID=A0A495XA69_9PSEU|nr:antibiotic biosynthesis monooxygenase family protein [Saccharothrix variisporea]RKT69985.1 antibiotic biosynthesis monooxygenase [Saccharothrix variisporea]
MLLVCRFTVPETDVPAFAERATKALELLTAQPGCRGGQVARSLDEPDLFVLTVEFDSVVAYRRALSPFEVREHVVPLLSEAVAEAAAFEPLLVADGGSVQVRTSLLASDAGTVRLGEAAGPAVPR